MKLLLTGASGFIGSAIVRLALEAGHQVTALYRRPPAKPDRRLNCVIGDLAKPPWEQLTSFDSLIHAAWFTTPGLFWESPENDNHLVWGRALVTQAFERGVRHALMVGTCAEYAPSDKAQHEEHSELAPRGRYGRCKDELRRFAETAASEAGASVCWARLFYPYGPGEPAEKLTSAAVMKMQSGQRLELKTPADQKDYIHVDDAAQALLTLSERQAVGSYNVASGEAISVAEVVTMIAEELGRPEFAPQNGPAKGTLELADITRLRELGWSPRTSLREGIRSLIASLPPRC